MFPFLLAELFSSLPDGCFFSPLVLEYFTLSALCDTVFPALLPAELRE